MRLFKKRHPEVGARPGTLVIHEDAVTTSIRAIQYTADRIEEREVSEPEEISKLLQHEGVTWVDVCGLRDEPKLRGVAQAFGLHALALEDIVNVPQRPKAEHYDDHMLLITRMASLRSPTELDVEQVSVVVGKNYVLTFQERPGDVFEAVRARLRTALGPIRKLGPDYLGYCIFDTIVDAYYPILEEIGDHLETLEDDVMEHANQRSLRTLTQTKNMLLLLRRAIWPQREAANSLVRDASPFVSDEVRVYLRDTHDHCVQTAEVTETYRELVSGLMSTYLTVVSNRTNDIMKVLTIVASIFIPLTFLAGIYGMNFDHMPELHITGGYYILLGVMAVIGLSLTFYFRSKGWLGGTSTFDEEEKE